MRFVAPHTIVVVLAAALCSLGALCPGIWAAVDPVAVPGEVLGEVPAEAEGRAGRVEVQLSDVFADPEAFLGRELRFTCQVQDRPASWNPYLTRFGRGEFGALRVWGDEQRLWLPEEYEAPLGLVFARRSGPAWECCGATPVYGRVELEGVVRQVFLDRPWIEVTRARALPLAWNEGALIHASRGVALMKAGQYSFAVNELERARATSLPATVDLQLAELEERCRASEP